MVKHNGRVLDELRDQLLAGLSQPTTYAASQPPLNERRKIRLSDLVTANVVKVGGELEYRECHGTATAYGKM